MHRKITGAAIVATILLAGCSSTATNTINTQSISYVKPNIKPVTIFEKIIDESEAQHNKRIKKQIVKLALSGENVPYVFSGINRYGWDCSGFTLYVYNKFGVKLKHSANKQGHMNKTTRPVPGDIVAISSDNGKSYYHVGIYLGDNTLIHANSHYKRTVIESLDTFKDDTIVFIRVI
jgi:cell wall-associated NlpC family hydrolase